MIASYLILLFGFQHLKKWTPISVLNLHHGKVDTHSYYVLFLNALAPFCSFISVQLNSVTSIIPLMRLILYQLNYQ